MGKDVIYVEFVDSNDKPKSSSIIEGLSNLDSFGSKAAKVSGKITLGDKKKKKKSKKEASTENKKKKNKSRFDLDLDPILSDVEAIDGTSSKLALDLDIDGLVQDLYNQEGDLADPLVEKERRSYKKKKRDKNPFKQEFAEELTILYDLYGNMNEVVKHLEKVVKQNDGSKVRGMSKYFNDSIMNLISARGTQLSIVKEMSSVKKVIADLKFKDDAAKAKQGTDAGSNLNHQASALLQQMMGVNRTEYLESVRGTSRPAFLVDSFVSNEDNDDDTSYERQHYEEPEDNEDNDSPLTIADIKDNYAGYTEDDIDSINQAIAQRIQTEGKGLRSDKGTAYIKYENRGVEVKIRKDIDSNQFDFIAVDRDNQVIYDYPLPQQAGQIKFNGPIATDRFGNTYKVVEYSSVQLS